MTFMEEANRVLADLRELVVRESPSDDADRVTAVADWVCDRLNRRQPSIASDRASASRRMEWRRGKDNMVDSLAAAGAFRPWRSSRKKPCNFPCQGVPARMPTLVPCPGEQVVENAPPTT